jgi:hypothetical protein
MDDQDCRRFFLDPQQPLHRRYEAFRAILLEGRPLDQVADRFGYRPAALKSLVSRFRSRCRAGEPPPFSSPRDEDAPPASGRAKIKPDPRRRRSPTAESWL